MSGKAELEELLSACSGNFPRFLASVKSLGPISTNLVVKRSDHLLDANIGNTRFALFTKCMKTLDKKTENERTPSFSAEATVGGALNHGAANDFDHVQRLDSARNCAPGEGDHAASRAISRMMASPM